ncbi:MAG: hypothetical protein FJW34_14595 [Acidobacteria bacterium]|nr:hypothetical protein [Acidobacteriota bacterium]
MTLQNREKRAVTLLGGALAIWIILWVLLPGRGETPATGPPRPVPEAEKRLARLRQTAATVPGKEELHKRVTAELAERERGVIGSETAAQALAQLLEAVRRTAKSQSPPLEIKTAELGQATRLGNDYGEIQVAVTFDSHIEELLNLLADLTRQPEIVATREIRLTVANAKEKTLAVRLTAAGVVPRQLVPEKRGAF